MILLDTNVLSELMRITPHLPVLGWIDSLVSTQIYICSISVAEILYGIGLLPRGKRKDRLLDAAAAMFDKDFSGRILSFDAKAATEYAHIVLARKSAGRPISMPDAQIAAICRVHGCTLATRNIDDFISTGIELIDPWNL